MRVTKALLFGCIFTALFCVATQAKTVTAISCSASDVQAAINQTSNGDTVTIPGGSATWKTTVTISNSHQITLDGGGCSITFSGGTLNVTAGNANNTRVTNFTFTGSGTNGNDVIELHTVTSPPSLTFRFDNNTLNCGSPSAPATIVGVYFNGPGLLDHNSFTCSHGADELIHVLGQGAEDDSGWWDVITPGGANMIFIEDNTFNDPGGAGASAFQSYYGARTVARHNTFTSMQIDQHGGGIGSRWWEFYNNNFTDAAGICLRAGSGMVYGNTNTGIIHMTQEYGTYPAEWQVGQGQEVVHGTPSNCSNVGPPGCTHGYVWNDSLPLLNTDGCAAALPGMIAFERDAYAQGDGGNGVRTGTYASRPGTCTPYQGYWATDQNTLYQCTATNTWTSYYTPYTYPHPLQGTGPAPPTNLDAIAQ
jgi:hypothetical protein